MNRVSLIGRITRDPEIRYSQTGSAYLMFSLAVNRNQRDASGQPVTDFISITAFGQTAEFISRYIKKGFLLAVAGRIQTRNYQDQKGETRYVTEVVAEQVENLTPRDQSQAQTQSAPRNDYNQNNYQGGFNNPSYGNNQNSYQENQPDSFDVNEASDKDFPF